MAIGTGARLTTAVYVFTHLALEAVSSNAHGRHILRHTCIGDEWIFSFHTSNHPGTSCSHVERQHQMTNMLIPTGRTSEQSQLCRVMFYADSVLGPCILLSRLSSKRSHVAMIVIVAIGVLGSQIRCHGQLLSLGHCHTSPGLPSVEGRRCQVV